MLSINMDDVMQVVSNIQNYLIAFGVVLVLALLVMFAVRKMQIGRASCRERV